MHRGDIIYSVSLKYSQVAAESRWESESLNSGSSDLSVDLFVDIVRGDVDFLKSLTGEI